MSEHAEPNTRMMRVAVVGGRMLATFAVSTTYLSLATLGVCLQVANGLMSWFGNRELSPVYAPLAGRSS